MSLSHDDDATRARVAARVEAYDVHPRGDLAPGAVSPVPERRVRAGGKLRVEEAAHEAAVDGEDLEARTGVARELEGEPRARVRGVGRGGMQRRRGAERRRPRS